VSNRIAITEEDKVRLFNRLIEKDVLHVRSAPRVVDGKMVEKTFIEHGATKTIDLVED
jgi:hypothetical protein